MAKKRETPLESEEIDRIAEAVDNINPFEKIQDRDTFDSAWLEYFDSDNPLFNNNTAKDQVFSQLQKDHPGRITDERLFTKAKGKNLKQDRKKTAKRVVRSSKDYKRIGASKVDLQGYDTAPVKTKRELNIVGKVKGKVVFSSRENVRVKGHVLVRHRDRLGRFVSVGK